MKVSVDEEVYTSLQKQVTDYGVDEKIAVTIAIAYFLKETKEYRHELNFLLKDNEIDVESIDMEA